MGRINQYAGNYVAIDSQYPSTISGHLLYVIPRRYPSLRQDQGSGLTVHQTCFREAQSSWPTPKA